MTLLPHQPQRVSPLVFAEYTYWFQADPRKIVPAEHVWQADGTSILAQHPLAGTGPWLSYDRADWHRQQLIESRRAGIDVILPMYRGAIRDRQRYADKGLLVLAAALQSLRAANMDYPQVGLFLDTTALTDTFGDKPDLHDPAVQIAMYGMIRDFYQRIPAPFRCVVPLNAPNGGRSAYPVLLSDAGIFKNADEKFALNLRQRFAADFGGADLILVGASGFGPQSALDGYFGGVKDKNFAFDTSGWIKTAVLSAGSDTAYTAGVGEAQNIRARRGGETYRTAWNAAQSKHPDWILLDGWNAYDSGANIAPSLEIGVTADDQTRLQSRLFNGLTPRNAKFLWHDAPNVMLSGRDYAVHLRAQNIGAETWGTSLSLGDMPVEFACRWLRNGQIVAVGNPLPLTAPVPNGSNVSISLPVAAQDANGNALPEGDYVLEIGPAEKKNTPVWFTADGASLRLPVHIQKGGPSERWAATLTQINAPLMLESGSVYPVTATLRNDGTAVWHKANGARITLRIVRQERTGGVPVNDETLTETPTELADATAELPSDVMPGQEITVALNLPLMDADGQPLAAWTQEGLWTYALRPEVAEGDSQTPSLKQAANAPASAPKGIRLAPIPVAIVDYDFGTHFTENATPPRLPGEKRQPVRLSLTNSGPQTWNPENVRVGYHWYYQDGTELLWEDETTPLTRYLPPGQKEVAPGQSVKDMLAWVTAPAYDGTYWLVWDVKVGDTWASTTQATRPFDTTARQVRVTSGRLIWADLTKEYNVDGISDEDELFDGNFDGQGRTFPALLVPPFTDMTAAPDAMWLPTAKTGPDSPRRISFRWGPKETGAKNFIACRGQRIELGKTGGQCRILHILAASTGKDIASEIKLVFQEPSTQSQDAYVFAVSAWDRPPTRSDAIAFVARHYHDRKGPQQGAVALYHYTLKIRDPRKLVALILPNEPAIKIAALTLEK